MRVYDLAEDKYIEVEQYSKKTLNFLYKTIFGRMCLKVVVCPFISKIYGKYNDSKFSIKKIDKFISEYKIDMNEYEDKIFTSFNDFFARKVKPSARKISTKKNDFIAPADSKVLVYEIKKDTTFSVKNSIYNIEELVKEKKVENFKEGYVIVFRLCVDDYHRYHFIDDGKVLKTKKIPGFLYTVSPIAYEHYKVFTENSREVSLLETENFGRMYYIEVGATMVGKIVNHDLKVFKRGDEKGYFNFGGSTVVLILEKDKVRLNKKLLKNSKEGIETYVKMGMVIGTKK